MKPSLCQGACRLGCLWQRKLGCPRGYPAHILPRHEATVWGRRLGECSNGDCRGGVDTEPISPGYNVAGLTAKDRLGDILAAQHLGDGCKLREVDRDLELRSIQTSPNSLLFGSQLRLPSLTTARCE